MGLEIQLVRVQPERSEPEPCVYTQYTQKHTPISGSVHPHDIKHWILFFLIFFLQISPFSGSSSTQNPGGAENAGVALQLCLPCYFHATPPSTLRWCDDVQSPTHKLHGSVPLPTPHTQFFTLWIFHNSWECIIKRNVSLTQECDPHFMSYKTVSFHSEQEPVFWSTFHHSGITHHYTVPSGF